MATHDDAITRSEEELHHAGTRIRAIGKVRVVKRIVTEYVDVRVPLRREELHVFEEDAADGDVAVDQMPLGEDTLELVLHAEEPVVDTRVVPRERVRVHLDVATVDASVKTDLRREVIEVEEDVPRW